MPNGGAYGAGRVIRADRAPVDHASRRSCGRSQPANRPARRKFATESATYRETSRPMWLARTSQ